MTSNFQDKINKWLKIIDKQVNKLLNLISPHWIKFVAFHLDKQRRTQSK